MLIGTIAVGERQTTAEKLQTTRENSEQQANAKQQEKT